MILTYLEINMVLQLTLMLLLLLLLIFYHKAKTINSTKEHSFNSAGVIALALENYLHVKAGR